MSIFNRISSYFRSLIDRFLGEDEDIDEPADPYVVDLVNRLESLRSRAVQKNGEEA